MHILMLFPSPAVRGPIPRHTPLLVDALRSFGCSVDTYPWGRRQDDETILEQLLGRLRDVITVRRLAGRRRFDVLVVKTAHDRATLTRDIALLLATRRRFRCIVLQFHGSQSSKLTAPGYWPLKAATRLLLRLCDAVMLLSAEERRDWEQFWPRGRFYLARNPFVPAAPGPIEPSKKDDAAPCVLFVGRLIEEKGVLDLLAALRHIVNRRPCRLVVVGEGPLARVVETQIAQEHLHEFVSLRGYLDGGALARAYREADIFAFPTYWGEGFPTVLSEAMEASLPIVTTPSRGAVDHLEPGVHALFVPPRDPHSLAETLLTLIEDQNLRRRMGSANRRRLELFAPQAVAQDYVAALREACGRTGPVAPSHRSTRVANEAEAKLDQAKSAR